MDLGVETTPIGNARAILIAVDGELDLSTCDQLKPAADQAVFGRHPLILDLSGCTFIDSSGLRLVLQIANGLAEGEGAGLSMAIVAGESGTRKMFSLTGIDQKVPVFDSRDEALAWLRESRSRMEILGQRECVRQDEVSETEGADMEMRSPDPSANSSGQRSITGLVKDLSQQSSDLARKEVELARVEMELKAKRLGVGAGAFGTAALVGLFALGALTATLILVLDLALPAWLAALIVTALYGAIAGAAALIGKRKVDEGTPPVPERAIDTTKEDVEHLKQSAKEARS
jgi:anti-anti-sigma factor